MKLATYRKTVRDIGPVEAARELGVSYVRYWRWEQEQSMPRKAALQQIMQWSDGQVTPNDFVRPSP